MNFNGRTVLFLLGISILLSSLVTTLVLENDHVLSPNNSTEWTDSFDEEQTASQKRAIAEDVDGKFTKIKEAFEIIRNNYVLEVDEDQLLEGAIEGMLNALDDPYTVYMDPDSAQQFRSSLQSSFEGIGAEVTIRGGRVTIVSPIRGAPAERAGLRPNDQILSVNGENLEGLDIHGAVLKIRGPKGTEAILEIARPGISDVMSITVIRDEIPLETVYTDTLEIEGKTIGKIELSSFAQKTASDFIEALQKLESDGMDGLIIDLRGNPGGYLEAVLEIGEHLVPHKEMITSIESRNGEKIEYRSKLEAAKPYPITVLINEGSASASEILASALQEAGGYPIVGKTSFGKGTVQSTVRMGDTSEIKITIAKWLTPKANWINKQGVVPDIEVEQPEFFKALPIQADPVLQRDMNNTQIQNLQLILDGIGYHPGRKDGFFSAETEFAVRAFQSQFDLQPTGIVDEETANAIHQRLIEVVQSPESDTQLQKAIEVLVKEIK